MQPDFAGLGTGHALANGGDIGGEGEDGGDMRTRLGRQHQRRKIAVVVGLTQGLQREIVAGGHQRAFSTAIKAAATARSSASSTL